MRKDNIAIIGDVHGCLEELKELTQKTLLYCSEIIFVGDLIDRGPDSSGVIEFIRDLEKEIKITIVEGNHEAKNFSYWKKLENKDESRFQYKNKVMFEDNYNSISKDSRLWLKQKVVPYVVNTELNFSVIHGGILPKIANLPKDPSELTGRNKKRVLRGKFIRNIDEEGNMVAYGDEKPGNKIWAETYDGRFGTCYFGHSAYPERNCPKNFKYAVGLDLGCVYGGYLASAIISPGSPFIRIHQMVAAKKTYAEYCSI